VPANENQHLPPSEMSQFLDKHPAPYFNPRLLVTKPPDSIMKIQGHTGILLIRIGDRIAFNYGDKQVFAGSVLFVHTIETEYLAVADGNIVTSFINSFGILNDGLFTAALHN